MFCTTYTSALLQTMPTLSNPNFISLLRRRQHRNTLFASFKRLTSSATTPRHTTMDMTLTVSHLRPPDPTNVSSVHRQTASCAPTKASQARRHGVSHAPLPTPPAHMGSSRSRELPAQIYPDRARVGQKTSDTEYGGLRHFGPRSSLVCSRYSPYIFDTSVFTGMPSEA